MMHARLHMLTERTFFPLKRKGRLSHLPNVCLLENKPIQTDTLNESGTHFERLARVDAVDDSIFCCHRERCSRVARVSGFTVPPERFPIEVGAADWSMTECAVGRGCVESTNSTNYSSCKTG